MVRYAVRATLPEASDTPRLADRPSRAFPDQGWRIRDPHDAAPGVTRFIDQTSLFMTLVGLTSLLVGGIGVANGVRAWLDARARDHRDPALPGLLVRTGARRVPDPGSGSRGLRRHHRRCGRRAGADRAGRLAQGRSAGTTGSRLLSRPASARRRLRLLTALAFSLWPLGRAARIPGAALFRDALIPERTRPSRRLLSVNAVVAASLIALTIVTAADRRFALWFCAAALGTLVLFRLGGSRRDAGGSCRVPAGQSIRDDWAWPTCTGRARQRH